MDGLPQSLLSESESRALLERTLAPSSLKDAPKLLNFLRFICERSILGQIDMLTEQLIGGEVFGRPLGYNSNGDNIVRANATRLR